MSQLRWGFIGNGWIANVIAGDFKVAGLKIQAVGARTQDKANEFAKKWGIPNRHDSYEKLVNDPEVDIVFVATPHPFHERDVLLAINAGKHVLAEKPFALNAKQATAMRDAAKAKGVFLMEAMWTRHLPVQVEIQRIIKSGMIGEVRYVQADHSQNLSEVPRIWDPELAGGTMLDLGVYPINFICRILGIPSKIIARGDLTDRKVDESISVIFEYSNGKRATFFTCASVAGPNDASIIGSKGRIEIARPAWEQTFIKVFNNENEEIHYFAGALGGAGREAAGPDGTGRQHQAIELERCVKEGLLESPVMPVSESVAIMKVMDEIRAQIGVKYPME